ncbi:hypothetical protein CDAR_472131 [Caerostris darwini]|uniref:Uncharacterized protein n=1 Tax=Caerostris darwini TaxID=1538125 RepID=A0AAV4VMX1_9ARAC|nr:hypothetical protein CDAR_472131 [Caerostris darwini]
MYRAVVSDFGHASQQEKQTNQELKSRSKITHKSSLGEGRTENVLGRKSCFFPVSEEKGKTKERDVVSEETLALVVTKPTMSAVSTNIVIRVTKVLFLGGGECRVRLHSDCQARIGAHWKVTSDLLYEKKIDQSRSEVKVEKQWTMEGLTGKKRDREKKIFSIRHIFRIVQVTRNHGCTEPQEQRDLSQKEDEEQESDPSVEEEERIKSGALIRAPPGGEGGGGGSVSYLPSATCSQKNFSCMLV